MKLKIFFSALVVGLFGSSAWAAPQGLPQQNAADIATNASAISSNAAAINSNYDAISANTTAIANAQSSAGRSVYDANGMQVGSFHTYRDMRNALKPIFFSSNGYMVGHIGDGHRTYYIDSNCVTFVAQEFDNNQGPSGGAVFRKASGWFMITQGVQPVAPTADIVYNSYTNDPGGLCVVRAGVLRAGSRHTTNQLVVPNDPAVSGYDPIANPGPYSVR